MGLSGECPARTFEPWQMKMTKELWARLDEIDGDTLIKGAELENWRAECRHQAKHNSDPKDREVFAAAAKRTCITRKHAR